MDTDELVSLLGFPIDQPAFNSPISEHGDDHGLFDGDGNGLFEKGNENGDDGAREDCSADLDVGSQRKIRRRARTACIACHKRKVRCDVLNRGCTCTNCRLDGLNCVLRSRNPKRRRKQPEQPNQGNEKQPTGPPAKDAPQEPNLPEKMLDANHLEGSNDLTGFLPSFSAVSFSNTQPIDVGDAFVPLLDPYATFNPSGSNTLCDMMFSYYSFVETEPFSHLVPEDFKFLDFKGCFHLPAKPVLDELVRSYFLHVHPALPLIDECEFWEAYLSIDHSQHRFSLFVLRAMLFASCAFVSEQTIQRMGFDRAIDARTWMYRRAKLLYDFNTTTDSIALAQGTLMLTYYCSDREPVANTIWLQLAIQYAYQANVPFYEEDTGLSARERLERKRLWWCIILRDRILPLGVRRPIQITEDLFDYSRSRLLEKDLEHEFVTSVVYDKNTKRQLAHVLFAQLDLAILLTDIMPLIYPARGLRTFDRLDHGAALAMSQKLKQNRVHLELWSENFEKYYDLEFVTQHKSLVLFRGLTQIYHHSAKVALCQHESFLLHAMHEKASVSHMKQLGSTLHASVIVISETVRQFVQKDVVRYMPISVVAYIALPILLNSLDVKSASSSKPRTSSRVAQLRILHETMALCLDRYDGTGAAQAAIARSIETGRVELEGNRLKSTCLARAGSANDWFEVFVSQPSRFLRIAFSLDISLSKGRQIQTEDLPQHLLSSRLSLTTTDTVMTRHGSFHETPAASSDVCEDQNKRTCLDFLSFDSPSP